FKLEFIHALHVPLDGTSGSVNFKGHIAFCPIDDPARFQHTACAVCKLHQGADVILVSHLSHWAFTAADIVMGATARSGNGASADKDFFVASDSRDMDSQHVSHINHVR